MTKFKQKSRFDDLWNRSETKTPQWNTKNKQPMTLKKVVEGRTLNYLTEKEVDTSETLATFNVDMFRIENITDIEAQSQLEEWNLTPSTLLMMDHNENGAAAELDRMEAEEWAHKYISKYVKKQEDKQ